MVPTVKAWEILTRNEHILIRSSNKLHGLLSKDSHVLIGGVARDVLIRTVVECNEDVQQYYKE